MPLSGLVSAFGSIVGNEAGIEDSELFGRSTALLLSLSSLVSDFGSIVATEDGESCSSPSSAFTRV